MVGPPRGFFTTIMNITVLTSDDSLVLSLVHSLAVHAAPEAA